MIFDSFVRTDRSHKRNLEKSFEFLNRSARHEIAKVRDFIESCAASYPESEAAELVARIRSGDDRHFDSATFELILYFALDQLDFRLQPHPVLPNGLQSRPDFLVTTPQGSKFYLEAVLASEVTGANGSDEAIKGAVYDALNAVPHINFLIDIQDQGQPRTQPSGKKLSHKVLKWLDTLDPDQVKIIFDRGGFDSLPTYEWQHEEWSLTFRPIPLKADRRGKAKSLIGATMGGGGFIDNWTPIRNAIKQKGAKYGQLDLPLLVAVNIDTFALDKIDELQALFGQEQHVFTVGGNDAEPQMERAPNGAWYGPHGPQYRRVSGAWIFNGLTPYSVAGRRNTIYMNPWSSSPIPAELTSFPHAKVVNDEVRFSTGISFREIFKLEENWPE